MVKIRARGSGTCQSCGVRYAMNKYIHLFRFPKEQVRCRLWIKNAGLPHLLKLIETGDITDQRLCNHHFTDNMFKTVEKLSLNRGAVPTIFFGDYSNLLNPTRTADSTQTEKDTLPDQTATSASTDGEGSKEATISTREELWAEYWAAKQRKIARKTQERSLKGVGDDYDAKRRSFLNSVIEMFPQTSETQNTFEKKRKAPQRFENMSCEDDSRDATSLPSSEEVSGYEAWSKYKKDAGQRKDDTEPLSEVMNTSLPRMEFSEAAALLQRLRNCEVFTWQNEEVTLQEDRPLGATGEMPSLCRLCASDVGQEMVQIFGAEGVKLRLSHKISRFLPVQVQLETDLPQQVCRECVNKLSVCDEVYRTWERAERTFRTIRRNKQADLNVDTTAEISARDNPAESESQRMEEVFVPSPQSVKLEESDETESEVLDFNMGPQKEFVQECPPQKKVAKNVKSNFFTVDMSSLSGVQPRFYCKLCKRRFISLMILSIHSFNIHEICMCGLCGAHGCFSNKDELNRHIFLCFAEKTC